MVQPALPEQGCLDRFVEIISPELWEAVQAKHHAALRAPKHDPKDKTPFPLRGLVYCQHCNCRMTPASHHGRIGPVGYYECIVNTKARSSCPVKRINASSLHDAVLDHIRRGAEHPTRLNELIKGAVEEMPVADVRQDQVQSLSKRIREVEKKEKAILSAIEAGGAGLRSLIERLGELQDQSQRLRMQRQEAEARVLENKLARPDVGYVQAMWQNFLTLWDAATDEEKSVLMPLIVERVELREKEYGKVRLSFAPAGPVWNDAPETHSENRFATDRAPALCNTAHKLFCEPPCCLHFFFSPQRMGIILSDYLTRFGKLHRNAKACKFAQHKPLLLAALAEIERGGITNNRIILTPELVANFRAYWRTLVTEVT